MPEKHLNISNSGPIVKEMTSASTFKAIQPVIIPQTKVFFNWPEAPREVIRTHADRARFILPAESKN